MGLVTSTELAVWCAALVAFALWFRLGRRSFGSGQWGDPSTSGVYWIVYGVLGVPLVLFLPMRLWQVWRSLGQ
jgi:hypothetical protein